MIETLLLDYLTAALSGIPTFMEEPERPPSSYVTLQKTGSDEVNLIFEATFAIRSCGATLLAAAELNERVKAAVLAMGPAHGVLCAKLNSDYEYTNTETKQPRYQAVFEIYY